MAEKKIQSTNQDFRLIPVYRDEIDVRKLCQVLVMAAREKSRKAVDSKVENEKI